MKRRALPTTAICLVLIAVLPTLLAPHRAHGGEITRTFTFDTRELHVANLIGAIDVKQSADQVFKVTVDLRGADATPELVQMLQQDSALNLVFPLDRNSSFVYPAMGAGTRMTTTIHEKDPEEKSWLRRTFGMLSGKRLTVRGSGNGLEVWADVTVEVPAGRKLTLRHGVGDVGAADLRADLDLDSQLGTIRVDRLQGDLRADTGSGDVKCREVRGDLDVDTGSGRVELVDCEAGLARVDTGSGEVDVAGLSCNSLNIDTGSGGVRATSVATDEAVIDTGSGDVMFQLVRMGSGQFVVGTGSGGVELVLPVGASAKIMADTGSGDIESSVPGAAFEKLHDGTHRLVVGDGTADVKLDTGSGSVVVSRK